MRVPTRPHKEGNKSLKEKWSRERDVRKRVEQIKIAAPMCGVEVESENQGKTSDSKLCIWVSNSGVLGWRMIWMSSAEDMQGEDT